MIGSAGSPEKVEWLRSLGVEAFDYRETPAKEALADGIDVYFDNVGGAQLEAALNALRPFGRVIACGSISRYNDERPEPGPRNLAYIVTKRLRVQGFIVSDHGERHGDFLREVGPWVRDGKIECRETIVEGIENVPSAFAGLFRGDNTGKMLVRVGPDDSAAQIGASKSASQRVRSCSIGSSCSSFAFSSSSVALSRFCVADRDERPERRRA